MLFDNIHVSCDDRMKVRFVMNLCKFFSFIYFRFLGGQREIRAPHKPSLKQQAGVCENPQHIKISYSAEGDTEWPSVLTA